MSTRRRAVAGIGRAFGERRARPPGPARGEQRAECHRTIREARPRGGRYDRHISFRISGLAPESIATAGALRYVVDESPGYPCRVTLEDAPLGETVLLVTFTHLDGATPYRASHAIFVRAAAVRATTLVDTVPPMLARRLLSVRAYDDLGMMRDAAVVEGAGLVERIATMLVDSRTAFLHVHTAARGCYLARVDRSDASMSVSSPAKRPRA